MAEATTQPTSIELNTTNDTKVEAVDTNDAPKAEAEKEEYGEFTDSFHYATLLEVTSGVTMKSCLYLMMSVLLLTFQILALLGFQIRGAYTFCQTDNDCPTLGQYCEASIGICKGIDAYRKCSEPSDCETATSKNFFCSTVFNHTCQVIDKTCSSASDCPYSMYCNATKCTNDFVENFKDIVLSSSDIEMTYVGGRDCSAATDCYTDPASSGYEQAAIDEFPNAFQCSDWGYCFARKSCSGDDECSEWQTCAQDVGYCLDLYGKQCNRNADCINVKGPMGNLSAEVNYKCPWDAKSSPKGTCYFKGTLCNSDSDCKMPGWQCNATVTSVFEGKYGWCYNPQAGQPDNFCQAPVLLPLDLGAMVFVAVVICINVAKDLREAIITEMKLRSCYEDVAKNKIVSWRQLCCGVPNAPQGFFASWIMFIGIITLEGILFIRKYMFLPLVLAVTSSAMNGQNANGMIMNGVAIFFVVEIDNLFFSFFHAKWEQERMEDEESIVMSPRQARYLTTLSLFACISMVIGLILVVRIPEKVIKAFSKCENSNETFRVGGLFMISLLFIGYFLASISVPMLEIFYPSEGPRKHQAVGKKLKERLTWGWRDYTSNAAWDSKLTLKSQLLSVFFIILQGTVGGLIFNAMVFGWYQGFIGKKDDAFTKEWGTDLYDAAANMYLEKFRKGLETVATYA